MAIYSMVKNNNFNGMPIPAIVYSDADGKCETIKVFDYRDFKRKL